MAVTFDNPDALFTTHEVAEFRRTTVGALAAERFRGSGPRYALVNRRVLYRAADLAAFIEEHTVRPRSAPSHKG